MKIELSLPYAWQEKLGERELVLKIPQDHPDVYDLVNHLENYYGNDAREILVDDHGYLHYHVFVNGVSQSPEVLLREGDRVILLEPMSGG